MPWTKALFINYLRRQAWGSRRGKMPPASQDLQGWGLAARSFPGECRGLDNAHGPGQFGQNLGCAQELFSLVRGADDGAEPRLAFRHRWVAHGRSEYSGFKKLF